MGAESDAASSVIEDRPVDQEPLLEKGKDVLVDVPPSSGFGFNHGNRPFRDIGFSIAFVLFLAASLAVGVFAVVNHNPDYAWVQRASYDRYTGCSIPDGFDGQAKRTFRGLLSVDVQGDGMDPSVKAVLYVFLVTLVMSAPLALFLLWVLRTYTKEVVYITLPFFFIIPVGFSGVWLWACNTSEECSETVSAGVRYGIFGFVVAVSALALWVLIANWDRVELTIRIIRTACEALSKNLGLLLVLPGLNLSYCVYLIPAATFLFYAYTNGKVVPNPEVLSDPDLTCGGSSNRSCCVWEADSWVPAYITLTTFAILWGAMVVVEVHVFTISGTIAQWYFATSQSSNVGTTKKSLGHALGPSFGTVCFSGLVIAIVRAIRSAVYSTNRERGTIGIIAIIIRACLEMILRFVEFVTKFTTNFAAITGESFCASAGMTFNLLRRNLLSTVVVESVAGRLLGQAIFVLSAVYGLLVWGSLALFVQGGKSMWGVALFAFVILLFFLLYCSQVLHNVIDTVYICFAMDKDNNEVSKAEVHDVYVLLPPSKDDGASLAVAREA